MGAGHPGSGSSPDVSSAQRAPIASSNRRGGSYTNRTQVKAIRRSASAGAISSRPALLPSPSPAAVDVAAPKPSSPCILFWAVTDPLGKDIELRKRPDTGRDPRAKDAEVVAVRHSEIFEVDRVIDGLNGQQYLHLADGRGWVFTLSAKDGRRLCEPAVAESSFVGEVSDAEDARDDPLGCQQESPKPEFECDLEAQCDAAEDNDVTVLIPKAKTQDDIRRNLLQKLSQHKVWVPQVQRPPSHQTIIIFDWDDTLLCTSFLNSRPHDQALSASTERQLRGIEAAGKQLLEAAQRFGRTFIITNGVSGWVEYSAAQWIPNLLPVLQNINVISARSRFEKQYPTDIAQWKIQAFLEVQRQMDTKIITNLVSLGDSVFEMDAAHIMGQEFAEPFVKTVKFKESPTPEELLKQLGLLVQKFDQIHCTARNLKICLERRPPTSRRGGSGG